MEPNEPNIVINGKTLSEGQALTVRASLCSFIAEISSNGLGVDEHGKSMAKLYKQKSEEVLKLMME